MRRLIFIFALLAPPALAEIDRDEGGTLNPEEMTLGSVIERAQRGEADMTVCMQGYFAVKSGDYEGGRDIFEACTDAGFVGAMHWRSYMDTNGLGGPEDAESAAEWDRKAAELGDPVGQFNYGLDLLRGHGVEEDLEEGRRYIDMAAGAGLGDAQVLKDSGYDTDVVTPDADDWRYYNYSIW